MKVACSCFAAIVDADTDVGKARGEAATKQGAFQVDSIEPAAGPAILVGKIVCMFAFNQFTDTLEQG